MVNLRFGGPNGLTQGFNWVFLLELIVVVIVVIFLLFFFNRVFAFVVSYIVRTITWHRYKAHIDVEGLQLSFLAGRILFKNFRYQSRNQSIHVLKGHITWRYWLRRVRVRENSHVKETVNAKLPCRISLDLEGVEWFIYNRTPAYDAILAAAGQRNQATQRANDVPLGRTSTLRTSVDMASREDASDTSLKQHLTASSDPMQRTTEDDLDDPSFFLHLLPIQITCKKGAISLGNTATPSIVVAQFGQANLAVDAAESRSKFDLYKMVYKCQFIRPTVQIKMNIDYKEPLLARASRVMDQATEKVPSRTPPSMWRAVLDMIPFFQESSESLARPPTPRPPTRGKDDQTWTGLPRYSTHIEDEQVNKNDSSTDPLLQQTDVAEYAKVTTVLDSSELELRFYYDEPGRVPPTQDQLPSDELYLGNGDLSPEWGMDIEVTGGTITYGPWADRQRAILQEMFFPGTYEDSQLVSPLKVGDRRVYAYFKVLVEFKDDVTFKVPTREKSKDWKYSAQYLRSSIDQRATARSFAWIEFKASAESTMTYHMGLTPCHDGWTNFLNLELKRLRLTTSINYGMFAEVEGVKIQCDLSNPLQWNTLHNWTFNLTFFRPSVFLLRDHVTLFSDCGADWTSSPLNYATWVPFNYTFNISLVDFSLFLNVNDGNIISSAAELNENSYVAFHGAKLSAKAVIPSDKISPIEHCVQFETQCPAMTMTVHSPLWNTLSALLDQQDVGHLHKMELVGSYTYPSDVSHNNIETLDVHASASYVSVVFYGFLLRYFFNVRNNYFGDHTQFVTLEEYQRQAKIPNKLETSSGKRPPPSNVLDIILAVEVSKGAMILPSHLYEVSEGIRMHFDMLRADVRFMDYYMDLQVNITPISCFHHLKEPVDEIFKDLGDKAPQAFVDGITVHAHRLLGKPPSNPAYICNWDFDLGMITGEVRVPFLQAINLALDSFIYNLEDLENALPDISPPDRDITFLRLSAAGSHLKLVVDTEEILICLGPVTLGADDRTSLLRSSKATLSIQSLVISILHDKTKVASFASSMRITVLGRRPDLLDHGPKQSNHVRQHDAQSRRAWYLYSKKKGHVEDDLDTFEIDLPPLPQERVESLHSSSYIPKCSVRKSKVESQGIHFASSYMAPDYALSPAGGKNPNQPASHSFIEETPMLHSSYSEIIATHVDNLPKAQRTIIIECSTDTSLVLTPNVMDSAKVLFQAFDTINSVASLDQFQRDMVTGLLTSQRDRSVVTFTQFIVPKMQICLQGNDGLGVLIDVLDFSPQLRSVHINDANIADAKDAPVSTVSAIASLRSADLTVFRRKTTVLEIPEPSNYGQDPLATFSIHDLDVKLRQAQKVFVSISLGRLDSFLKGQQMDVIYGSIRQWGDHVEELISTIQKTTENSQFKFRHLVAAIVLAGDEHGITNDPPFLTRPSHVLRISKNALRVNDSWKILARIRHIARSLPPEVIGQIEGEVSTDNLSSAESMEPVLQILSRWRSWELSNIRESYFFKWLSGNLKEPASAGSLTIEGVVILGQASFSLDVGDGFRNTAVMKNATFSSNERLQQTFTSRYVNVMGVDINCESFGLRAETDILDLLQSVQASPPGGDESRKSSTPNSILPSSVPLLEYRGTVLIKRTDLSARMAGLGFTMMMANFRLAGFSQLYEDRRDSPSFCLSFEGIKFAILNEQQPRESLVEIGLDHFSAQMISAHQKPGVAASLGLFDVRLLHPMPLLMKEGMNAVDIIKKRMKITPAMPMSEVSRPSKPDVPTIIFRLHRIAVEAWLVPDIVAVQLDSGGIQMVLGELSTTHQWGFFDIPPAKFTIRHSSFDGGNLTEISTPFIAVKSRLTWTEGGCALDSDVQVGHVLLPMQSLASLFQILTAKEVVDHFTECVKVLNDASSTNEESTSASSLSKSERMHSSLSYRVHSLCESIEIGASTPDGKVVLAFSDIHLSFSNRHSRLSQSNQLQFTAGSRNTTVSLLALEDQKGGVNIASVTWEIGNSITTGTEGKVLYRLYLVSDSFLVTLSPRSISQFSRVARHVVQEVRELRIKETLSNIDFDSNASASVESNDAGTNPENDPFEALDNIDAVRVSFSQIKFRWLVDERLDHSQGFTFSCKTMDASVLDHVTRGRFVVQEGELELNSLQGTESSNYARLPKLDFNIQRQTEADGWQLQLDAHGDTVEVNFTPSVIDTGHRVLESISIAAAALRVDFPSDSAAPGNPLASQALLQQTQKLKAVVTSINFSGAQITAQYDKGYKPSAYMSRYHVKGDGCTVGGMAIPGLSLRSRFSRKPRHVFHAEICILESSNVLSPLMKPFIHDILRRIERVMSRTTVDNIPPSNPQTPGESIPKTAAILGDLKFSVGLRIQSQDLTLTCDPFAKVDANVGVDEIYATLISCKTANHDQTFALTVSMPGAHAILQHHYSGIASAKIKLNDLYLSMFNNDQIRSTEPGVSAILKSSALDVTLNARQGQDFLIFNSLWLEGPPSDPVEQMKQKRLSNPISMQQLQKVTASPPSFPINVTVLMDQIKFALDLGQSIGTTDLDVRGLRLSNRKCSEFHHCIIVKMDSAEAESTGRFSGYMKANDFLVQTSIYFPAPLDDLLSTPLVQIDVKLGYVEFRTSFEYHVFLIGDSSHLRFTIYNRRIQQPNGGWSDRLVFVGDSDTLHLYATAEGPSLVLSLYKAVIKLQEEKEEARDRELSSFKDRDSHLAVTQESIPRRSQELPLWRNTLSASRVDMEMSIKFTKINVGIFKSALNDSPVFRTSLADIRALFSQNVSYGALENRLDLSLGAMIIALSPLKRMSSKELAEMEVEKWIRHVSSMRGGVILAVPETEGSMWTRQEEESEIVQHIFKSRLDGKVDIGWNYGSVRYVQELWKTFELKLKEGEEGRVSQLSKEDERQIKSSVEPEIAEAEISVGSNLPLAASETSTSSRVYTYVPVEPAIVETPQLRQMGEATPPMEWIGVNRMKLPAFTHQALIVPLQKVSRRVENLYNLTLQSRGA